jgi:hypothetical protein
VGIKADTLLANPGEQTVVGGECLDGRVGYCAPRPEQNEAELIDGYGSIAREVVKDQAGGFLIELSVFEIEVRPAVTETREFVKASHGSMLRFGQGE